MEDSGPLVVCLAAMQVGSEQLVLVEGPSRRKDNKFDMVLVSYIVCSCLRTGTDGQGRR